MKSTILSIVPLVGFALAQKGCNRPIVTKTETEKVYVTVQPSSLPDITVTSTIDITTTITVRPSTSVEASATGLHWGSYPNGTWSNHTSRPLPILSTASLDYTPAPITETPAPTNAPSEIPSSSSDYYEYSEASEAPVPTSETPSVAQSSPVYAADVAAPSKAAQAQRASAAGSKRGEATFYGGNTSGGTCSFTGYTIPSSLFGTALAGPNWNSAANCGACVSVTGPKGNKITAMIVDQCPGCSENHLDLYTPGFAALAELKEGIIPISWDIVPCGITSPIVLKNKSGTSPYWFSMQVQNANIAVASLEVSTDAGKTWKKTQRQQYNYFENSAGFGTQTVDVKVTSTSGQSIVVKGVSVAPDTTKAASGNFS